MQRCNQVSTSPTSINSKPKSINKKQEIGDDLLVGKQKVGITIEGKEKGESDNCALQWTFMDVTMVVFSRLIMSLVYNSNAFEKISKNDMRY